MTKRRPTFVILTKAEKSHFLNDRNAAPHPVISIVAEGSGVEKSHSSDGTGGITAGDLSAQRFMSARAFTTHIDMQLRSR